LVFLPGVPIHLPEEANLPGSEGATAVIAIDAAGQYYFENQVCNEAQLKQRLQLAVERSRDPVTLVVQADEQASVKVFVRLAALAGSLGIREMLQAVRPRAESRSETLAP